MSDNLHNRELAENKILLLYILDKLSEPATLTEISAIPLKNRFMVYFDISQCLSELCNNSLARKVTTKETTLYNITEEGRKTLALFIHMLPNGIKSLTDDDFKSSSRSANTLHSSIKAEIRDGGKKVYEVHLSVLEDEFIVFDFKMSIGNIDDAKKVCENFENNAFEIYRLLIDKLINNEKMGVKDETAT